LQAMTGSDRTDRIEFQQPSPSDKSSQLMGQAAVQFTLELDALGSRLSPVAIAELEQALVIRFLLCNRHNYSDLLEREPLAPAAVQLRRAEDYIRANWDKPLDVELIASVANVSIRSIFRNFQKERGYSPQAFVKRIRLERARALLLECDETTSVLAIALKCGFHSFGHFARSYRTLFGELPSATLQRSRSAQGFTD
jgi:transcriptional regulator GlxA family with amidase domain